jgi:hypothetical protein
VLRRESSPIDTFEVKGSPAALQIVLRTRETVPAFTLEGYKLRAVVYGLGDIPQERFEVAIPRLAPGQQVSLPIALKDKAPMRVQFDVLRPTGFSAWMHQWRP